MKFEIEVPDKVVKKAEEAFKGYYKRKWDPEKEVTEIVNKYFKELPGDINFYRSA